MYLATGNSHQTEIARAVHLEHEVARRGIKLRRSGANALEGPCPICGGRDRFWINTRKQRFWCRHCERGGSDAIALVRFLDGCSFPEAIRLLAGDSVRRRRPEPPPAPAARPDDNGTAYALARWAEGEPIAETLAYVYLERRGLLVPVDLYCNGEVLRFHPACPFGPGERHPCLLSLWRNILTNQPQAIQRTALTAAGDKLGRKALGPIAGAAAKLADDADVALALTVGEGLETSLAAMTRDHLGPAWALGSAAGIANFPVLPVIEHLTILVDNDAHHAGERAAAACSARWTAAGRSVRRAVRNGIGRDFADPVTEDG
jgi:hypothetical protein